MRKLKQPDIIQQTAHTDGRMIKDQSTGVACKHHFKKLFIYAVHV